MPNPKLICSSVLSTLLSPCPLLNFSWLEPLYFGWSPAICGGRDHLLMGVRGGPPKNLSLIPLTTGVVSGSGGTLSGKIKFPG